MGPPIEAPRRIHDRGVLPDCRCRQSGSSRPCKSESHGTVRICISLPSGPFYWAQDGARRCDSCEDRFQWTAECGLRSRRIRDVNRQYRYVWSAAGLQAKTSDGGLVCANVFGLQRDAFPGLDGFRPLSSLLGCWPWGAASDIRFRKRRFDRCAIFESASRPGEHRYSVRCCC